MTLLLHVTNRIKDQDLIGLTNPEDDDATTIDTTYLGYAVDDGQADFEMRAQTTYDDADKDHIRLAVRGVVAYLHSYGSAAGEAANKRMSDFHGDVDRYARHTSRARVEMETLSNLEVTATRGTPPRPAFDDPAFDRLVPNRNAGNQPFDIDE